MFSYLLLTRPLWGPLCFRDRTWGLLESDFLRPLAEVPEPRLALSSPNTAQRFLRYFPLFFSSHHIPIAIVHTQVSSALLSSAGQTEHCELEKVDSLESVMRYRPWSWGRMTPSLTGNVESLRKRGDNMWRGEKHTNLKVGISVLVLVNAPIFSFYPCPQPLHFCPLVKGVTVQKLPNPLLF